MNVTFYRNTAQRAAQKTRSAQSDATNAANALHHMLDQHNHHDRPHGPREDTIDDCVQRLQRLKSTLERHAQLVVQLDDICRQHNHLRQSLDSKLEGIEKQTMTTHAELERVLGQRDLLLRHITVTKKQLQVCLLISPPLSPSPRIDPITDS